MARRRIFLIYQDHQIYLGSLILKDCHYFVLLHPEREREGEKNDKRKTVNKKDRR